MKQLRLTILLLLITVGVSGAWAGHVGTVLMENNNSTYSYRIPNVVTMEFLPDASGSRVRDWTTATAADGTSLYFQRIIKPSSYTDYVPTNGGIQFTPTISGHIVADVLIYTKDKTAFACEQVAGESGATVLTSHKSTTTEGGETCVLEFDVTAGNTYYIHGWRSTGDIAIGRFSFYNKYYPWDFTTNTYPYVEDKYLEYRSTSLSSVTGATSPNDGIRSFWGLAAQGADKWYIHYGALYNNNSGGRTFSVLNLNKNEYVNITYNLSTVSGAGEDFQITASNETEEISGSTVGDRIYKVKKDNVNLPLTLGRYHSIKKIQVLVFEFTQTSGYVVSGATLNIAPLLKTQGEYTGGTAPTVTYSSSDTDIATVDPSTGVVTGVSTGTATITATSSEGMTATFEVTVCGGWDFAYYYYRDGTYKRTRGIPTPVTTGTGYWGSVLENNNSSSYQAANAGVDDFHPLYASEGVRMFSDLEFSSSTVSTGSTGWLNYACGSGIRPLSNSVRIKIPESRVPDGSEVQVVWQSMNNKSASISAISGCDATENSELHTTQSYTEKVATFVVDGDGGMVFALNTNNAFVKRIIITEVAQRVFEYESSTATYPLVETDHLNMPDMTRLPRLKRNLDMTAAVTYSSSNPAVAYFWDNQLHLKRVGTATITATMGTHTASYELTVTGNTLSKTSKEEVAKWGKWDEVSNKFTFVGEGLLPDAMVMENPETTGYGVEGLKVTLGSTTESHIILNKEHSGLPLTYAMRSIDYNGWSHVLYDFNATTQVYTLIMGSFLKLETTQAGVFKATGTFSNLILANATDGGIVIVSNSGNEITTPELAANKVYYLFNNPYYDDPDRIMYIQSFSFSPQIAKDGLTYTISPVRRGMIVEVEVSTNANETAQLSLNGALATTYTVNGAAIQPISTFAADTGNDNPFEITISVADGSPVTIHSARAYYKEPELKLNYTPQAVYNHHGNWTDATLQTRFANNTGVSTCFDVQGVPTFTAYFEETDYVSDFVAPTASSTYTKTGNIEWVTTPTTTPKATIRSTGSGSAITDATVSVPVTLASTAMGYDPTTSSYTAKAQLPVIPFPYTWNLTSGTFAAKTKALELENVTDDGGAYVLLGPGSVAVHGIAIVAGREKPKTNYQLDAELPNSRLSIPVMKGMKVSITSRGAERRVTGNGYPLQISNVTDLRGYATATMEILTTSNTQDYIAKEDGYVEIYNRSDVNVYLESITVTAPELIFEDGNAPKVSWSAEYQNRVLNTPTEATLTFSHNGTSSQVDNMTADGTFTFKNNASGTITVTATTGSTARNLEPCWGQYTMTLVNFYFSPNTISLTHTTSSVSYHANVFLSYAKLYLNGVEWSTMSATEKAKFSFSVAAPSTYVESGVTKVNNAKGIVTVRDDINDPYVMEVRNDGQLIITAVYRDEAGTVSTVKTSCTINITRTDITGFKYPAPTVAATETSYTFTRTDSNNPLDNDTKGNVTSYRCTYIGKESDQTRTVTDLGTSTTLPLDKSGVYHVEALNSSSQTIAEFYLTKAYPVNEATSQSWDFRNGLHTDQEWDWSTEIDKEENGVKVQEVDEDGNPVYDDDGNPVYVKQTLFQWASWSWAQGMPTNRGSDYRYRSMVNGNNGFIVKETAGLQIVAAAPKCDVTVTGGIYCDGHFSAYSGETHDYVYPNIGLHQSTLIIPRLPKGAYVAVAWDRTSDGDGNTVFLENLLDLEGKTIDEIKYGGSVRLTGANAGRNQGYYTFRVANNGDVTFTQNDKGTSRIVAIHVYYGNPDTKVNASDDVYYNRNATQEFKGSGMTQKLMAYARSNADGTADVGSGLMELDGILTTEGETTSQWLTNYLSFSAPNGVPEFKMVNQDETLRSMSMDMSQTYFDSGNGTYAVPGLSFKGACWGKAVMSVGVRDNNGYLVAYRQYRFTVGVKPKMQYPKTWDFTRFFDNVTVKIEDSPVTVLPATVGLNTKNSLAANSVLPKTTISTDPNVKDTDPTRTWDTGNVLMRSSGDETYLQYGYNEYSSYYVDDAVLVCNKGSRNADGFVMEETRGLGFSIAGAGNSLQWVMLNGGVGYGDNSYLLFGGTMTIAKIDDATNFQDYYVFVRSSAPPTAFENIEYVAFGDDYYGITDNVHQYVYRVSANADMKLTFNSGTSIYGIGVTNIKKNAMHPVGGIGWATESREVDIDHTLTGYYTSHPVKAYEVESDSYDMNTATVRLTEVRNTDQQTYDSNTNYWDHGYVSKGNGVVLAEFGATVTTEYKVPLFYPAITTTKEAAISTGNLMRPNLVRRENNQETDGDYTRFLLTNVHWTFAKDGTLAAEESDTKKIVETDAAGFYRQHVWKELTSTENAAKNTLTPNTAYLLVPTSQLPLAVWNSGTGSARVVRSGTIGIRWDDDSAPSGISQNEVVQAAGEKEDWYSLDGRKLNAPPVRSGLYIHRGKKVVVKH